MSFVTCVRAHVPVLVAMLVAGILILASAVSGETLALAVVVAGCSLPIVLFVVGQALSWREPFASGACVALVVLLCAVFRIRDIDDKSIDAQILCKLACLTAMAAMTITAWWRRPWPAIGVERMLFVGALTIVATIGCVIAINPVEASVETCANALVLAFLASIIARLGARRLRMILLATCACLSILSLVAYVAIPSLGRMTDWVGEAYVVTNRLQGVFGAPNAAGASAAFCLLMLVVRRARNDWQGWEWALVALFGLVLVASNNRMAIGAAIAMLAMYGIARSHARYVVSVALCGATLVLLLLLEFGAEFAVGLSRSGDLSEVTGGSGRVQIWSVVIDLWSERPLFGYGIASGKFILPHHPLLFSAAAHAHSLYFNALFAGGIVGLTALVACLVVAFTQAWQARASEVLVLLGFFLIYGITEPIIGGLPSSVSILFAAVLLLANAEGRVSIESRVRHPSLRIARSVVPGSA